MTFTPDGQDAAVGALAGAIDLVSVHEAIPDDTGSDEVAGGDYARQAVAWTADGDGVRDNNATVTHDIPASTTAVAYGWWDSGTSTFYGHTLVGSTTAGAGCVDPDTDTIESAGHGLVDDDRVAVYPIAGSLPAGLAERTLYWVVGADTDTFQVATSQGGAAVDITDAGEVWWVDAVPEAFGSAGELTAGAGDLTLDATTI